MSGLESGLVSRAYPHDPDTDSDPDTGPERFHASPGALKADGKLLK